MPADECVLGGSGKGVTQVKLASDVGRWHDDDKGLLAFLDAGLEVAVVHPGLVDAAFDLGGVVDLRDSGKVFSARCHRKGIGGRWGFSELASTMWADSNFGGIGESIGDPTPARPLDAAQGERPLTGGWVPDRGRE